MARHLDMVGEKRTSAWRDIGFGPLLRIVSGWFDTLFGWFHRPATAAQLDHADKPDPSVASQAQQGGPQTNIDSAGAATINNHNDSNRY